MASLRFAVLASLALNLGACAAIGDPGSELRTRASSYGDPAKSVILKPREQITVFVWRQNHPTSHAIGADGRIAVPLAGPIMAAGKTPYQLARDIESELGRYMADPIVNVVSRRMFENSYAADSIIVRGEVARPLTLDYARGITALDVLINVGGLARDADGNNAILVRRENREDIQYRLRLDDLARGDISANKPLAPGDRIYVPGYAI